MTDNRFKELIAADKDMMTILTIIASLPLRDAWLAAGAIRNFIWNQLAYGIGFDADTDIDVVFLTLVCLTKQIKLSKISLIKNFQIIVGKFEIKLICTAIVLIPNRTYQRVMPFQSTPSDAQLLLLGGLMTSWNCLPLMG